MMIVMKWSFFLLFSLFFFCSVSSYNLSKPICNRRGFEQSFDQTKHRHRFSPFVDPFIGTGGDGYGAIGLSPSAQVPFGMMRVGPDTCGRVITLPWRHLGGYSYCDSEIQAFSHLHLVGAGLDDLGNLGVMPLFNFTEKRAKCGVVGKEGEGGEEGLVRECQYKQKFSHEEEEASPGFYSVVLNDPLGNIKAEMTAARHAAVHRYDFDLQNQNKKNNNNEDSLSLLPQIIVDPCHSTAFDSDACKNSYLSLSPTGDHLTGNITFAGSFSGRTGGFNLSFSISFSTPFSPSLSGIFDYDGKLYPQTDSYEGVKGGAYLSFPGSSQVEMDVGISFLNDNVAESNLLDVKGKGFDQVLKDAGGSWEDVLGGAVVEGFRWDGEFVGEEGRKEEKGEVKKWEELSEGKMIDLVKFYTAMYHSFCAPTNYTESTGEYFGFDHQEHKSVGFNFFSDLSIWDIFRTEYPLLVLLQPQVSRDVVISMLKMSEQSPNPDSSLPKWAFIGGDTGSMEGLFSVTMMADFLYNANPNQVATVNTSDILLKSTNSLRAQEGENWEKYGYIPGSVSKSLCFAFNDYCVSRTAAYQGDISTEQEFKKTSKNWNNLWNSKRKFLCDKDSSGNWTDCARFIWPDIAADVRDHHYTEGDAWHYRWFVPHDLEDLIEKMGGNEEFTRVLDGFFVKSEKDQSNLLPNPFYWAGNEPDIQTPYLFVHSNAHNKTVEWVRELRETKYTPYSNGLSGNDDYGTLSAWFVWSGLGLFPEPCMARYTLGVPLFSSIQVTVDGGVIDIKTHENSQTNDCSAICQVTWNGEVLEDWVIPSQTILHDGSLDFWCC